MSKRGFSFPDLVIQQMYSLMDDHSDLHMSLNHTANVLVELGFPVFHQLSSKNPALARELLKKNYSYKKRQRASEKVMVIASRVADSMKIDDRLYVGVPSLHKQAFAREKRKRGVSMSAIARERMGIAVGAELK